jgi:hypothetical protein
MQPAKVQQKAESAHVGKPAGGVYRLSPMAPGFLGRSKSSLMISFRTLIQRGCGPLASHSKLVLGYGSQSEHIKQQRFPADGATVRYAQEQLRPT